MVKAEAVGYRYHDRTFALSNLTFRIEPGEFVALLGPNGAGKTSLFKVMLGLNSPYEGQLTIAGLRVNPDNLKQLYQKVGYLFQNPDDQLFMPNVFDDVAYGPQNLGLTEAEVKELVDGSLKSVGMDQAMGQPTHTLSAGQKKRVALAGILAMNPEIMLLDEPTAGLDPAGVHRIMRLLKELNQTRNLTVLMATHNVDLLPTFMDRAIVMNKGEIVCQGSPHDVFSDYGTIEATGLKLPEVAQLMKELEERHGIPLDPLPLTIAEAREALTGIIQTPSNQS